MMEIRIKGLERLVKKLDGNELLGWPLRRAFRDSVTVLLREVHKRTPVDRNELRGSITFEIDTRTVPLWGKVGTDVKYAPYVEFGTEPHWPPLSALQPWARRHGFPPGRAGAFLVARAIARHGTKAREFFKGGFEASESRVRGFFDRAAKDIEGIWGR